MTRFKGKSIGVLLLAGLMLVNTPFAVSAAESEIYQETEEGSVPGIIKAEDIDISNFNMPDFNANIIAETTEVDINAQRSFGIEENKESIDVSAKLNQRGAFQLADNPNIGVSGTLTASNTMDIYFFNVSEVNKFMLGRLKSGNANYLARLYILDSLGNATPTNVYGFAGELIQLNGLPVGEYAIVVTSNNDSYDNTYTFDINATNPAANLNKAIFLSRDLSIFIYENSARDIYGNGKVIYNSDTKTGPNLEWTRYEYLGLEGGFQQRTHSVKRPVIKAMSSPATYSSATASSDCVVFLYCDINTSFSHMFSYYMSAPDPIHFGDVFDTTGRVTPRSLDNLDFRMGNEHVLVFDLNTGKSIDFYSSLNLYYAGGYEAPPTISFYN